MSQFRILKVQNPAIDLPFAGRRLRLGAHNFMAVQGPDGSILEELHGIARGPGGAQLRLMGGLIPFRGDRELIWGERFGHRTGFYDESYPQGPLFTGPREALDALLERAEAVRTAVNARAIRYPWPAMARGNSNAYYAALLKGMGLPDVRLDNELWAPAAGSPLI